MSSKGEILPPDGEPFMKALAFMASPKALPVINAALNIAKAVSAVAPAVGFLAMLTPGQVQRFAALVHWTLAQGLSSGAIVPDRRGGFVPAHGQSIYDKDGLFTGEKT